MEHNLTVIGGQGLTSTELEERRTGIGGSDAGAIIGVSPWATAHDVWLDKTGQALPQQEPSEPMEWGNRLEDAVRRRYREQTGRRIVKPRKLIRHPERSWQIGHPDGLDRDTVLEVKVVRYLDGFGEPGTDEVPPMYKAQVGHYMDLTGRRRADLIALVGSQLQAHLFTIEYGPWCVMLREELAEWWQTHIVEGVPPEVDGSDGAQRMLRAQRRSQAPDPGQLLVALPHQYGVIADLLKARRRREFYERQEALLGQQVQQLMGEADELQAPGVKITYKMRSGYDRVAYKEYATGLEELVSQLALGTFPVNMDPIETVAALRSLHTSQVEPTPVFKVAADDNTPLLMEATDGEQE